GRVQQVFGVLMLATAALMVFNLDVQFTVWATTAFAPQWTNTLQSIEQIAAVKSQLHDLTGHAAATPALVVANATAAPATPASAAAITAAAVTAAATPAGATPAGPPAP